MLFLRHERIFDKKHFPVVTAIAHDALVEATTIRSGVNVARIDSLYKALKETEYGNSTEVMQLGVDIWKAKQN